MFEVPTRGWRADRVRFCGDRPLGYHIRFVSLTSTTVNASRIYRLELFSELNGNGKQLGRVSSQI